MQNFMSYNVGDIITLSDVQTMVDFDQESVDLEIENVKRYKSPDDAFYYVGYVCRDNNETAYMIVVKTSGDDHEIYVYYLNSEGELYKAAEDQEECPFWGLLDDEQDDLLERIHASVEFDEDNIKEVDWDKQFVVNGVEYSDSETEGVCTLGEYYTEDDMEGNNYCLIDMKGEPEEGYVEVWYGCKIEDHEIEFHKTKDEE